MHLAVGHILPDRVWGPGSRQLLVRITWISRSLIFLRKVLRLTPRRSAARIWLPRVAASAADSNGYSISRKIRWYRPGGGRLSPKPPKYLLRWRSTAVD